MRGRYDDGKGEREMDGRNVLSEINAFAKSRNENKKV